MERRREFLQHLALAGLGWMSFREVSMAIGAPKPFRIGFFTDVHAMEGPVPESIMGQVAEAINSADCDLLIFGGDAIHLGRVLNRKQAEARGRLFRAMLRRLEKPVELMIGNHDLIGVAPREGKAEEDPRAGFREFFEISRTYRRVDVGRITLIFLDPIELTGQRDGYVGRVDSTQLLWLKSELQTVAADRPIVLGCHIPLRAGLIQTIPWMKNTPPAHLIVQNAGEVLACLRQHALKVVLQGHLHINESLVLDGVHFVTGGAVCGRWWRGPHRGSEAGWGVLDDLTQWKYQPSPISEQNPKLRGAIDTAVEAKLS